MPAWCGSPTSILTRSADCGLIEAQDSRHAQSFAGDQLPRSADRGLIEARLSLRQGTSVIPHYRDQLIAASLKLARLKDAGQRIFYYRDQLIAASLKRLVCFR